MAKFTDYMGLFKLECYHIVAIPCLLLAIASLSTSLAGLK